MFALKFQTICLFKKSFFLAFFENMLLKTMIVKMV